MYIIPKKYDAAKVRLEIKKKMAAEGKDAVLIPKLGTLYDVALEKSGLGKGKVIMKEDFFCLLDQIDALPNKFKNNNRNYKSAIFALLNEMAFASEELDSYQFHSTVHAAGLTRSHCDLIYKAVRERGFMFRAEVYREALSAIESAPEPGDEEYILIPGEYYTHLEQELLDKLGARTAETGDKNHSLCNAMFSDTDGNFQIADPEKMVGFLKADSIMGQYAVIKNHILKQKKKDSSLHLDDFCIVLGSDDSLALCTSFYESAGFHPLSSASVQAETPVLDGLNLISYALSGDIEKIIRYYNRHNPENMVIYDPDYDFGDFWQFCTKLAKSDGSRYDKLRYVPASFKEWIQKLAYIRKDNRSQSVAKNLDQIQKILKNLDLAGESLYEYRSSPEQVFGTKEILFADLVEYFKNILAGRKRTMISTWDDGVVLVKMGEYIPKCRFIYFADLEEDTFLKDKMPNLLLSADEHDAFNTYVYGCTKEEHLKKCFGNGIAAAERVIFVIPTYDEGTVVSEYVENALRLFPAKTRTVKVVGGDVKDFNHSFCRSFKDIEWENADPKMASVPAVSSFAPHVMEEESLSYVLNRIGSATRIEAFMKCPAQFIYNCQQPETQLQYEMHFTRGNAFHMFCELFFSKHNIRIFGITNANLPQEVALYLSGLPCDADLAAYMDSMDVRGMFKSVCEKYPDLELKDTDLLTYLVFICRCMKDTMKNCDSSSIRLEVFIGGAPLLDRPPVQVGEGYIDMMFRTITGGVVLVDFKSADINEYADDVASFSNVQLLIYKHIVEEALQTRDFTVFQPSDDQRNRMKEKGKDESSILEGGYFDSISENASVSAYYLSYKSSDNFKSVDGIAGVVDPFGMFCKKLTLLLQDAADNVFRPSCNKDCKFCSLNAFCPDRESGESLDAIYEKIDLKGPFIQNYPVPAAELTASKEEDEPVKIIQFGERAKYAAVADTDDDIIISAGAGAGKTEVLTTRYLNLLLNTGADLENILCITFTEKAAGEMKKRIFAKLRDTLSLGAFYSIPPEETGPGAYRLSPEQIRKLKNVKKNFFRNNRISTFHSFCLNMLTRFEKENPSSQRDLTSTVADDYMIRDRKIKIIGTLVKAYAEADETFRRFIAYLPFYVKNDLGEWGVVKDILDLLNSIKLSGMPLSEKSLSSLIQQFRRQKDKAIDELWSSYKTARDNLLDALEEFKTSETRPSSIRKLEEEIKRVTAGDFGKDDNYPYKTNPDLKSLLKTFKCYPCPAKEESCTQEEEERLHELLFKLLLEADRQIEKYKVENSIIELSDYHLNLLSLMENTKILERIRSELLFIMVDEFQDTNWLQKKILDRLHARHNHLFVVGDLKQSIYRFQQCDNQIFKQYRDQDSIVYITFQENFRSASQIVDFNNKYFTKNLVQEYQIIPNTSKDKNKLELGIPRCAAVPGPAVYVAELGYPKGTFDQPGQELSRKEENALLREQEAFYIARTIAATGKEQYGKWGILVREYTNMGYILEALQRMNIPYSFCIKKNFFRQPEIVQVLLVLQVLYGFLPKEALDCEPALADFVRTFDKKEKGLCYAISSLMKNPKYAAVRSMLWELLLQCREFVRQSGESPEEVLTQLLKFAQENSKEIDISALEDGVKIMTVHSSKGLEFDYLFVSKITDYTGKGGFGGVKPSIDFINYVDEKNNQIIDYDINGIKTLVKDDRPMLYSAWMKNKNTRFESEEKGNLLYVAFTRAKKHLVVTTLRGEFKGDINADVNWLRNIHGNIPGFPEVTKNPEIDISFIEPVLKKDEMLLKYPVDQVDMPDPELATMSVSRYLDMLGEEENPDDEISDVSDEIPESTGAKASEVGTAVHSFFEKNVHNLASADPEKFDVPQSMRSRFLVFAKAGLAVPEYQSLIAGAEVLMPETAMVFHTPEGKLLNGVIDLIVRKGNHITVLDYKTHTGDSLEAETLARYKDQVSLYAHGLKAIHPECTFDGCLLVMYSTGDSKLVRC